MLADALLRLILAWPSSPFSVRPAPAGDSSNSWLATLPFGPFAGGGLVQEVFPQGMGKLEPRGQAGAALRGSNRAYLVADATYTRGAASSTQSSTLGKTVSLTVDVSEPTGRQRSAYLVAMDRRRTKARDTVTSRQSVANSALKSIFSRRIARRLPPSTRRGDRDGPCNQWGCAVNFARPAEGRG